MADFDLAQHLATTSAGMRKLPVTRRARVMLVSRLQKLTHTSESQYMVSLSNIIQQVHGLYNAQIREDAITRSGEKLRNVQPHVEQQIRRAVGPAFDRMAQSIKKNNAKMQDILGIDYSDIGLSGFIAKAREANIQLVIDAGEDYAQDVADVLRDPENRGLSVKELADVLADRADVSDSRAQLIARDQTLRLNRQITATRQQNAGVSKFTWSTSMDERVRPTHAALEGKVFSWSSPPPEIDDINCRCVQIPAEDDDDIDDD